MQKIAVIYSVYPEIAEVAEEFIRTKGYHIEIAIAVLEKAVELAKKYENDGFDVIISRGVTGALIRNAVNIPVILVDITNFDVLETLFNARKHGKRLAFFKYKHDSSYQDLATICEILDIDTSELKIYLFEDEPDLKKQITKAYTSPVDVVVTTGAYILEVARQHGLKTVMVRSSKEAIYNAFRQADEFLKLYNKRQSLFDYFQSLLSASFAAVIILDADFTVQYVSCEAIDLFQLKPDLVLGKHFLQICDDYPTLQSLRFKPNDFSKEDNLELDIDFRNYIVRNRVLYRGSEIFGYAITLTHPHKQPPKKINHKRSIEVKERGLVARYTFSDMLGNSESMQALIQKATSYAQTDLTILITGESGTGKEVLANSIHNASARKGGPFVAINCAALPQTLLESELFGYEDGAFTGAKKGGKAGLFELAEGGTVFLDEVSEMNLSTQVHLLRVLQEKIVRRIGGSKLIPIDVRIIAATNADLTQKVKLGEFRQDLYYRINVLRLIIPPIREHPEDIPVLLKHFLQEHLPGTKFELPELFLKKLSTYHWPGNVRELKNFAARISVLIQHGQNLFPLLEGLYDEFDNTSLQQSETDKNLLRIEIGTLKDMELQIIELLNEKHGDNKTALAEMLNISRSNLWSKLKDIDKKNNQ